MGFEADSVRDGCADAPVVSGQHYGSNAKRLQQRDTGSGVFARLVPERNEAHNSVCEEDDDHRFPLGLKGLNAGRHVNAQRYEFGRIAGRTYRHESFAQARRDRLTRDGGGAEGLRNLKFAGLSRSNDRKAERMARPALDGGSVRQYVLFRSFDGYHIGHLGAANRERAGFVEGDRLDPAESFQVRATLNKEAASRPGSEASCN